MFTGGTLAPRKRESDFFAGHKRESPLNLDILNGFKILRIGGIGCACFVAKTDDRKEQKGKNDSVAWMNHKITNNRKKEN